MRSRPARFGRLGGDSRARNRAAKVQGPLCPLALELARSGSPIGVAVVPSVLGGSVVVVVDADGELFELFRGLTPRAVRWCIDRHLRVYPTLGLLVDAMKLDGVIGWVPGRLVEFGRKGSFLLVAVPLVDGF